MAGEAGIGKSRLIAEFSAASRRSTARLVRAECREFAQSPLGPFSDILMSLGEPAAFLREAPSSEAQLEGLLATFARVFERRATVVIVEDLHWASPELISALRLLVARAETQRALFVLSYRDNEIVPGHANFIPLGKLARERSVSSIGLGRFDLEQIARLLECALGSGIRVPRVLLTDVARRSDGNPLYGEELLRHAVDGLARPLRARSSTLPISLHAIVRERVERCSPRERAALETAALFGRDFDREELGATGGEAAAPSETELARLVEHQLLVLHEPSGRYAFRHALTRDVIYGEIPEHVAKPRHRRIAAALEARDGAATAIVEIAHHHFLGGDLTRAAGPCEAAGALARAQFAYDECIRWYERALVAHGSDEAAVARVRLELGKVLVYAHELERGIAEYETVAVWARTHEPALFVRSRKLIAGTMAADGRREDAIALLESTRATLDENDAPLASDLALRSASFMLLRDDPSEARRSLARLNPRDLGTEARAELHRLRSEMHARAPGDDVAWRADAERAIELYAKIGSARFEHFVRVQFGWQALARGDIRAARASLEAAERRSSESASTSNHLPISAAFVELAAGRLKAARAWLARVVAPQQLLERAFEAAARTEVALALDDVAELERWIDLSLIDELERADEPRSAFRLGTAFGCALVRLDRHHEADRVFERVAPLARTTFEIVPGVLALAAFRPDLTASFLELLENGTTTPFLAAARSMLLAEAAREAGRPPVPAALGAARDFYASADWIPLAARAAELEGDRATAAAWYREIGHVAGVRRLGRAAFRPADVTPLEERESALSARELQVARCIASGTSNREAAAALSLSVKTIEKHLSSIYLKLGLQSRAQLATYVAGARPRTASSR